METAYNAALSAAILVLGFFGREVYKNLKGRIEAQDVILESLPCVKHAESLAALAGDLKAIKTSIESLDDSVKYIRGRIDRI